MRVTILRYCECALQNLLILRQIKMRVIEIYQKQYYKSDEWTLHMKKNIWEISSKLWKMYFRIRFQTNLYIQILLKYLHFYSVPLQVEIILQNEYEHIYNFSSLIATKYNFSAISQLYKCNVCCSKFSCELWNKVIIDIHRSQRSKYYLF